MLVKDYERAFWNSAVDAMKWGSANLPPQAGLVSFGMQGSQRQEQIHEWMPTIAERTTLDVIYGTEWKWRAVPEVLRFQSLDECEAFECLEGVIFAAASPAAIYMFTTAGRLETLANTTQATAYQTLYERNGLVWLVMQKPAGEP
jgi:hypothetical protein